MIALNPQQSAAVEHEGSHLLIVAGPGTGKTRTLVERIRRLTENLGSGEKVLAVTFTNKAAGEMQERLEALQVPSDKIEVATFHAFSLRLLRRYREHLDFPLTFSIASSDEIEGLARAFWPGKSRREQKEILKRIAEWKASLASTTNDPDILAFRALLRDEGLVDLDDILRDAILLLRDHADIRSEVRRTYPQVCVDEYQDINALQEALLQEFAGEGAGLTAIGDPNQAIYGFRGSDVGYFHSFEKTFSPVKVVHLSENYRSGQGLVSAGGQMIRKGARFPVPEITAAIHDQGRLIVHECPTDKAEAEYVAHAIERLVGGVSSFSRNSGRVGEGDGGRSFSDIAVLYRLNTQGRLLAEALSRLGVPFERSGDQAVRLSAQTRTALRGSSQDLPLDRLLSGLRKTDKALDAYWDHFAALAEGCADVTAFLDRAALWTPEDAYAVRSEKVRLMTLHAAKGLEFPVVIIVGCEEGLLPLDREGFLSDPDEERRLFYVGMTRAREELYLVRSHRRTVYGKTQENAPSRFLADIDEALKAREAIRPFKPRRDPEEGQMKLF
ncbi:MAG: ATP-dependent helicase [Elusimicrobia bacterium]|nr:ATP-dependent helicase [Elusimicrobiota bacterium]